MLLERKSLQQPEWKIYYLEESWYFRKYRDIMAIRSFPETMQKIICIEAVSGVLCSLIAIGSNRLN